jgi:hypothetical protein
MQLTQQASIALQPCSKALRYSRLARMQHNADWQLACTLCCCLCVQLLACWQEPEQNILMCGAEVG